MPETPSLQIFECFGLNDLGQVVGARHTPGGPNYTSFRYVNGEYHDFAAPGYSANFQTAINNVGMSVGFVANLSQGGSQGFWHDGQSYGILPDPGGAGGTVAVDINDRGSILLDSIISGVGTKLFMYRDGVATQILPVDGEFVYNESVEMNERDEVVGIEWDNHFTDHNVFYWSPTSGLKTWRNGKNYFLAINDHGTIAGRYFKGYEDQDAAIWRNGIYTRIPIRGWARAITNDDTVWMDGDSSTDVFRWRDGKIEHVRDLIGDWGGYSHYRIIDANEAGQVLVSANPITTSDQDYLILTPVPEPGTLIAISAGIFGVAASRRKRRR
jgi:hypothetical protein